MNDWRVVDWRSLLDLPIVSMVVRNVEERQWLVKIIEYISVAAITATVVLYASDSRQQAQIDSIKETQKLIVEHDKELNAEVDEMRRDLYMPRAAASSEAKSRR